MRNLEIVSVNNSPASREHKDITCGNCVSSCCKSGTVLYLSDEEAKCLRDAGTELQPLPPRRLSRSQKILSILGISINQPNYEMVSNCGNLEIDIDNDLSYCRVYMSSSPIRPGICSTFPQAGNPCLDIRLTHGVDTAAEQTLQRAINECS